MASLEQCQDALAGLIERLAQVDPEVRRKYAVERTVTCRVSDLDVVFLAQLADDGTVSTIETVGADGPGARTGGQVGLTLRSDDLIALIEGRLGLPAAWATGRLKIDASLLDLLKLRALL